MEKEFSQIDLPIFLKEKFQIHKRKVVSINKLFVGLKNNKGISYVHILNTPHYWFAKKVIDKEETKIYNDINYYQKYINQYPDSRSEEKFLKLINSIQKYGYNFKSSPILVFRSIKRPVPICRWDLADGFHRLATLAALGTLKVEVITLKRKHSFFRRVFKFGNE